MLNLAFPSVLEASVGSRYVLPADLGEVVLASNAASDNGPERRLQPVFGFELWRKLAALGLGPRDVEWSTRRVIDLCAGAGFLSYHLLRRVTPRQLVLIDISEQELATAEALLRPIAGRCELRFAVGDVAAMGATSGSVDVAIGNSFLHHLHDVPAALTEVRRVLASGGSFVGVHEPTPTAAPLERGDWRTLLRVAAQGEGVVDRLRTSADDVPAIADVWMFPREDLRTLLLASGFSQIEIRVWQLVRSLYLARRARHSSDDLSRLASASLAASVEVDLVLSRVLPSRLFGSCSFRAHNVP